MIYCVEDDAGIRELMIYTLRASGFEAEGFSCGDSLFAAIAESVPELILLDIMLPDMDGLEILKQIRSNISTAQIPVIMASAKGTEYDRVTGLDLGADDYLTKPFGMMEMVSRIRAVLRRSGCCSGPSAIQIGDVKLDPVAHTVQVSGERIELTLKEFDLLQLFLTHPGRVFTRDQLLEQVWGTDFTGESRTVDVHIGTLRTKLCQCGSFIHTVRGVGYRLEENS